MQHAIECGERPGRKLIGVGRKKKFPPAMPVGPVVEQPQRALGLVSFNTKWPSTGVCLPTFYLLQQCCESTC